MDVGSGVKNIRINEYKNFFRKATNYKPYPYQESVFSKISKGKSVVLHAPTGSGKTLAVLMPFLYYSSLNERLFDRVIYALPMRALAFDLYNSTIQTANDAKFKVINDPEKRSNQENEICITIQTGERQDDHFFEGDIIFTTIDQLLSSYLTIPVSLPDRLGNINTGAIIGSLVVFDEVHLMEFQKSFLTAVEMMNRLKGLAQFCVMTATLTEPTQRWLSRHMEAELVKCKLDELRSVSSYKEKSRIYSFISKPLSSNDVIEKHKQKTLVLCNTVGRAQMIYFKLKEVIKDKNIKIALLHSRFFKNDRNEIEKSLQEWFGKRDNAKDINAILVSTQVVEAGIDISCDTLHTELAPANALIQRAGRCARYEGKGTVLVYELEKPTKPLPYGKKEIDATRKELDNFTNRELDSDSEGVLVERVHAPIDEPRLIDAFVQEQSKEINNAMDGGHSSYIRKLIRDVDGVNILLTSDPESVDLEKSWPEMLSVPRSTLRTLNKLGGDEWSFKIPIYKDDEDINGFIWEEANSVDNIAWLAALNPKYAKYSSELGLIIGEEGQNCVSYTKKVPQKFSKYTCESYLEHVNRVIDEARSIISRHNNAIKRLALKALSDRDSIEKMILLACALHDTGKLSMKWQKAMHTWQGISDPNAWQFVKGLPLAHTTYDPKKDWKRWKELKIQQGPHAAEGAYAVFPIIVNGCNILLNENIENISIATMAAIARHHGPRTSNLQTYDLIPEGKKILTTAVKPLELNLGTLELSGKPNQDTIDDFKQYMSVNEIKDGLFFYWLCARVIRLADQRASSKLGRL